MINIESTKAVDRLHTPIELSRKLYEGCFGVVTWYALKLVASHIATIPRPLMPCTGTFTRSYGLPCVHLCEARSINGLIPSDFHTHWLWDRQNQGVSLRDPLLASLRTAAARNIQNPPATSSTGRILSGFEQVENRRTPPLCSACKTRGHTRASRNCPIRLRQEMDNANQQLLEWERSQYSSQVTQLDLPTTSFSPQYQASGSSSMLVAGINTASNSVAASYGLLQPANPSASYEIDLQVNQRPVFQPPPDTGIDYSSPSIYYDAPSSPSSIPLLQLQPKPILLPLRPLKQNRAEVIYEKYLTEKYKWLETNQLPDGYNWQEYRAARGWDSAPIEFLRETRRFLPQERYALNGDLISNVPRWSLEEIQAWLDYDEKKAEKVYEDLEQEYIENGGRAKDQNVGAIFNRIWREIAEEEAQDSIL